MLRAWLLRLTTVRYAFIADIHANIHALDAVLADIDARSDVDAIFHLGDLVGYGAFPNEVAGRLQSRAIAGVCGNYDSTVANDFRHCGCRVDGAEQERLAHLSFEYTKRTVTSQTKRYLRSLPFSIELRPMGGHAHGPRIVLVHGTPTLNTVYWTHERSDDFCRTIAASLSLRAGDLIAFGHTHKPWQRVVDGIHFINAGSVGRPKDGDPRAAYALIDMGGETPHTEFIRVAYDRDAAVAGLSAAGLPGEFGEFLRSGGVT